MKLAIALASAFAVSSLAGVAHADKKKDKAEALFNKGKKLMDQQRYADACESFEESYKADPAIGTQLNIAKCYEEWGKLGRAFTAYKLAEKLAVESKDNRLEKIREIIENLDMQVPRLTIRLPKNAPKDLKVTLDTKPITSFGEAFVVDPGPHTIEYGVGKEKKQRIVPMDRGAENEITLDVTKAMIAASKGDAGDGGSDSGDGQTTPPDDGDSTPKVADKPAPGRSMRIGGIALGGAGVLAIGVSTVMTISARGKYNDALDMHCGGMTNNCNQMGLDITHDARSTANIATVVFIAGAAAVAGGVALYLLAPSGSDSKESPDAEARYLVPSVTDSSAGLVYGGRF